jgi:hypothetical protein
MEDISKLINKIESMIKQYDQEYDIRPGPRISYIELSLAGMIGTLANEIMDLKKEIAILKGE